MTETTPARIAALDITRGFAVMGILLMNIVSFGMPENAYISPLAWGQPSDADIGVWAASFVLVDSKMRALFSMMFGASTLLVIDAARAAGRAEGRSHYTRMGVLAIFGLVHYYVIWTGDILFNYACAGAILFFFRNMGVKGLTFFGCIFILLNFMLLTAGLGSLMLADMPGAPETLAIDAANMRATLAPNSAESVENMRVILGGLGSILHENLVLNPFGPLTATLTYLAETLGLMLIGMALYKSGLLRGEWAEARRRSWLVAGFVIGLVGNIALLIWQFARGLDAIVVVYATLGASVPFDVVMTIAYAALFIGLAQRFAGSAFMARMASVGRAAFTNYLGTSILMTAIFYGWGLGLFGSLPRIALYPFVLGTWAIMLLWSKPWLDRFQYGPLEWLWRSLSRGALQPMRRGAAAH
ncbi:MAG: DUF418 domain-containing protein [Sphingomonadales bacterium]|nr:DUF418 domain-containing protein [Sphingomonadales bacterium]